MSVYYAAPEGSVFVVGRDASCDLVLEESYVSRKHLIFHTVTYDVAFVEVTGSNGATVDRIKQNKGYRGYVRFGDRILIGQDEIIWRGQKPEKGNAFLGGDIKADKPDVTPFEIEGPPQRRVPEKPSVALAALPALTMAIPILLGASRYIAILSAVLAAVIAAANVLTRARKQKSDEIRRKKLYTSYIMQCERDIRSELLRISEKLGKLYPGAGKFLKEGGDPFILWRAGREDDNSIRVRAGVGRVDSPMDINIPKDRFTDVDDSLKSFPGIIKEKYRKLASAPYLITLHAGSVHSFIIKSEQDLESLAAFILWMAAAYSPENMRISMEAEKEISRYFMWITLLPHYRSKAEETVLFTDDVSTACAGAGGLDTVILIGRDENSLLSGVRTVINRRREAVRFDRIPRKLCFSYSAQMSRLWGNREGNRDIPGTVPFGRLFFDRVSSKDEAEVRKLILENYRDLDVKREISAQIGEASGKAKVLLDLHEKASGPHGVISGTTGSGKSELLTTLILSFAARYPPDEVAFFLVDYKGGGMSDLFSDLPHLAGAVSNLSRSEAKRAMTALWAEIVKRQKLFAEVHVNNINDYTALYESKKVDMPLPHVLIIVDEFAELKREEPEFLDCLISVSQTGRSLGMHLILATQKPSGVIDDRIRANSRFRIALRLVDRADSNDLIGNGAACELKECGRAFLQVGNNEIFECFQSGYAFARAEDASDDIEVYDDLLMENRLWSAKCAGSEGTENRKTWFELFMGGIENACEKADKPKCRRMWLPPLPDVIEDERAFAFFDDPYEQRYEPAVWTPEAYGHLLIAGPSGSGKSELLRSILRRYVSGMELYIADCGGGKLKDFSYLNMCGGYVAEGDRENMRRLTDFVFERMTEARKRGGMAGSLPVVFVIDNMEEILKDEDHQAGDRIRAILSTGVSAGIYVIASMLKEPDQRTRVLFNSVLLMGEHEGYGVSALLNVPVRDIPKIRDVPGRGLGLLNGRVLEFQAVIGGAGMSCDDPGRCAAQFPYVPEKPTIRDLLKRAQSEDARLPVAGYEYESGRLYTLPVDAVNCILVYERGEEVKNEFLENVTKIAAAYDIPCVTAQTYGGLLEAKKEAAELMIVTVPSVTRLLEGFYDDVRDSETEEELASLFENPPPGAKRKNNTPVLIGIIDNELKMRFSGRRITDSILKRPYGISFGGRLNENRILDYSYLPFSRMQKTLNNHIATILKFDENHFEGDVIIPWNDQCG